MRLQGRLRLTAFVENCLADETAPAARAASPALESASPV
ncbi:hypothetical protein B0G73_102256 [Paraburkholderia sp. BL25I1N1]|nr:hypothetical protein B0G73_102256 [Paraburkholderia sp. BL25I1N1]